MSGRVSVVSSYLHIRSYVAPIYAKDDESAWLFSRSMECALFDVVGILDGRRFREEDHEELRSISDSC